MNASGPGTGFAAVLASLNCDGRRALWLLAGCALLLLPEAGGEVARAALRYEREAIAAGELWRLVTAHWVHLDLQHAALNALGLALMWALFARDYAPRHWVVVVLASAAAVDAGLWLFSPEISWYVGASGVLHGVMSAGTVAHVRRRELDGWVLAAFLVAKLAYEQWSGALPLTSGGQVVVDAHLYGALGGLLAGLAVPARRSEPL